MTMVVFEDRAVRRVWRNSEWWFSVVDVCGVLTASPDPGAYWRKLKRRLSAEAGQPVTFCHGLKLEAPDGKKRETDCANTEGLFRMIQTIPKAEPFKRWLPRGGRVRPTVRKNRTVETHRAGWQAAQRRLRQCEGAGA